MGDRKQNLSVETSRSSAPTGRKGFSVIFDDTAQYSLLVSESFKKGTSVRGLLLQMLAEKEDSLVFSRGLLGCLYVARSYERLGNTDSALWFYKLGIKSAKSTNCSGCELQALFRGLGMFYAKHSDYVNGIINYNHAIILTEKNGDSLSYLTCLSEAGKIYQALNENDKAAECFLKARDFAGRTQNYSLMIYALNSLGDLCRVQKKFNEAITYHEAALDVNLKLRGTRTELWSCTSLGKIYTATNRFDEAEKYFAIVLEEAKRKRIPDLESQSFLNLAQCHMKRGRIDKAIENGEKAFAISKTYSDLSLQSAIANRLSEYYTMGKKFEQALLYYKIYKSISDSLENTEQVKKQVEAEFKFKEEKLVIKMEKNAELLRAEEEKGLLEGRRHRIVIISFSLILLMAIIFSFFIYKNLRKNRRQHAIIVAQKAKVEEQKALIEEQKFLVEEKQKEVLSSIHYAKRIQTALFASEKYIHRTLTELKKYQKANDQA